VRWEKAFNPQNTRCIPPVKRPFPALILGPIEAFQAASDHGFKASPRSQHLRWEKGVNLRNTRWIALVGQLFLLSLKTISKFY
jgi:hypothetical protein